MKVSKLFGAILLGAIALGMGTGGAYAVCSELGGYAIFQCADLAYFQQPPGFVPEFNDPNNPLRVTNITAAFWQVGFGNSVLNSGLGSEGTGNSGLTTFNGNDSGLFVPEVREGSSIDTRLPVGSLCLGNNNWGNGGIDGCCDNPRNASLPNPPNDDILNPLYDVYYSRNGYPGRYSTVWVQDYPTAVLLKTADQAYFAVAGVTTMDRGSDGTATGPCAIPGEEGTNPAPCDFRVGFYSFKDISNGLENPSVPGAFNIIPWQRAPRPKAACIAGCTGDPTQTRTINFQWDPVFWFHDGSTRPTTNPYLAPTLADRAAGVGMLDVLTKANVNNNWKGLVRYDLERAAVGAANLDPNGRINHASLTFAVVVGHTDIVQPGPDMHGQATGPIVRNSIASPPDTCYRVRAKLGKKPETLTTGTAACRLGKCGDKGYEVATLNPIGITCIGGPLASEQATNVVAQKSKGKVVLTWNMTSELSVTSFDIFAISTKGVESPLGSVSCKECSTGVGASYAFESQAKGGVKAIKLVVNSLSPQTVQVPLQ